MNRLKSLLLVALCFGLVASTAFADDDEKAEKAKLAYKSVKKWKITLPNEVFTPVGTMIKIPHADGNGFVAELDGPSLAIDSNGDGKVDEKAKGVSDFITLKAKRDDGSKFQYSLRLVNGANWSWAASGYMRGTIKGERISLIDQNNNGRYDEFGVDAMIIGKSDVAGYLSKVINLGGELFQLAVEADGSEITVVPFTGETGTLNVAKGFESRGKLLQAVVQSDDPEISFDLADFDKGMKVPVGTYTLVAGKVELGSESALVRAANKPMRVMIGADYDLAWGGPIRAEFEYTRDGENVTFDPNKVWYFGKAGEEYYNWIPDATSPKFVIYRADDRRKIAEARFGGC